VPRASHHEAAIRTRLNDWAKSKGLSTFIDGVGNLIIRKPASVGREKSPGVVLQGHLDMVTQKNSDSAHDFSKDPIRPVNKDGWLIAEETTLGADNGMGVSMILAVLEDKSLVHGPLEAMLTIDEESGMTGAHGLEPGKITGRLMINLDTEDWGEFYLGCAGGLDVDVRSTGTGEPVPAGWSAVRLSLRGLRGGHSGVDIHEGRGNAIRLLLGVIENLGAKMPVRLGNLDGGTARNAIAREAFAVIAVPSDKQGTVETVLAEQTAALKLQLKGIDEGVLVTSQPASATELLSAADQTRWMTALMQAPYGVRRMSTDVPGVVETSNNLGVVKVGPREGQANLMVRSLVDKEAVALADDIVALFSKHGFSSEKGGAYPGWKPNPTSALLKQCQAVYSREFGGESAVKVIHAGLECGIIGAKYPGMDTVSFGPSIRGAHAPGEKVEIASVGRCWRLLREILASIS
jgi:dipeptidase D